jgi:hypothetical protein
MTDKSELRLCRRIDSILLRTHRDVEKIIVKRLYEGFVDQLDIFDTLLADCNSDDIDTAAKTYTMKVSGYLRGMPLDKDDEILINHAKELLVRIFDHDKNLRKLITWTTRLTLVLVRSDLDSKGAETSPFEIRLLEIVDLYEESSVYPSLSGYGRLVWRMTD